MKNMIKRAFKHAVVFALVMSVLAPIAFQAPDAQALSDPRSPVSAGSAHTLFIDQSNKLWAWGDNSQGQLGDGTMISRRIPVEIMESVTMISSGDRYNFAIRTDGSLWAWGQNDRGQLGDGTRINRRDPVEIMQNVIYTTAGWKHTDGGLSGEPEGLYDPPRPIPPQDAPVESPQVLIWQHSLAITGDGTLWAWGDNNAGQLGDGTNVSRHSPIRVMDNVAYVSAGNMFTMAIRNDGSLWAWGRNDRGQFGNGTTIGSRIPVRIMDDIQAVYAGDAYTMIIRNDGSLWAMGQNDRGQFGNGNRVSSRTPLMLMDGVSTIAASGNHTMAIMTDGSLWAWGQNDRGQFGNGTTINSDRPTRIMEGVVYVAAGDKHTMAIREDGSLWGWGLNNRGQLGNQSAVNSFSPIHIMVDNALIEAPERPIAPTVPVIPPAENIRVIIDGRTLSMDVPPMTIGGRTLVPLRAIFTAMGAEVLWNPETREITASRGGVEIKLTVGSDILLRNGQSITLDVSAFTAHGRVFVPARAIAESFGAQVHWDENTRTIVITQSPGPE